MASRSKSKVTTDHDEIRRWVEERGGRPAVVKSTRGKGDEQGILHIDFPGFTGEGALEPTSWEEFFKQFDHEGLAFVYQEATASGQKSNFNKIVKRETVMERAGGKRSGARKTTGGGKSERGSAEHRWRKQSSNAQTCCRGKQVEPRPQEFHGARERRARSSGGKSSGRTAVKRGRSSR